MAAEIERLALTRAQVAVSVGTDPRTIATVLAGGAVAAHTERLIDRWLDDAARARCRSDLRVA